MRLSHFGRRGLASRAPGFALIPSLTWRTRWRLPPTPAAASDLSTSSEMAPPSPDAAVAIEGSEMRAISFVSAIVAMVAGVATAEAGGFAVREQSAYGQGSSFAGMAAPGDSISSMFWNPAAVTTVTGITVEGNLTAVFPRSELDVDPTRSTLTRVGHYRQWRQRRRDRHRASRLFCRCLSPISSISG